MSVNRVEVRRRKDDDLDACVQIVREVHRLDGYPPYLPNNNYHALLAEPVPIAAIALYEAWGWTHLGTIEVRLPDGRVLPERIFAAM